MNTTEQEEEVRFTQTRTESHSVETYRLDLNEDERKALRSAPGSYLRKLLESEGRTVNAILVDMALIDSPEDCLDHELVHFLSGFMASTWGYRCIPLQ
jgi:hypothetical protein